MRSFELSCSCCLQILEQIICAGLHAGVTLRADLPLWIDDESAGGKSEEEGQHCKPAAGETTSQQEEPYLKSQVHVGQMNQQVNASNGKESRRGGREADEVLQVLSFRTDSRTMGQGNPRRRLDVSRG